MKTKRTLKPSVKATLVVAVLPMLFGAFAAAIVYFGTRLYPVMDEKEVMSSVSYWLTSGAKAGVYLGLITGVIAAICNYVEANYKEVTK